MPIVKTHFGNVEGSKEKELSVFRGIPYAQPPIDSLRFLPPRPHEPWTGTRQTTKFGSPASQLPSDFSPGLSEGMSEDCLTLNVWTPACDEGRRPVMVWIHGGSFLVGASSWDVSDGALLAQRGGLVVVSINYRVGAFGFLHLAGLGDGELDQSGNNGLLDQIAALTWVRDNISQFGGDPGNVTVFGCSAGAISISALIAMPLAHGLFHKAIAQSGASIARSTESASAAAQAFMEHAGAMDLDALRALSVEEILSAQRKALATSPKPDVFFGPVVDGAAIPEPPLHAIAEGRAARVPLLIGTNLDEMRFWLLTNPAVVEVAPDRLMHVLHRMVGDRAEALMASHRAQSPEASEEDIRVAVLGDINFRMPAIRMAESHARHQPETWMYLFTWPSPCHNGLLGAAHAIEQPFVFGTLDSTFGRNFLGDVSDFTELSRMIQNAWIAFARNGSPNHDDLPIWPQYDGQRRSVMHLDTTCRVVDDTLGSIRQAWDGVPFDGITPPVGIRPRTVKT